MVKNKFTLKENLSYIISRSRGISIETDLKPYLEILKKIKHKNFSECSDKDLKNMGNEYKKRAIAGEELNNLLPGVFALTVEVCKRITGIVPYDTQIIAGIVMHREKLAQMQTGEGKTLAAVFPAVLNSLTGKGVHIMTANDYLAGRDARNMGPLFNFLGLSTAHISEQMTPENRKKAYKADVTYLTAKECGFDLLRDNLRYDPTMLVQRGFHFAIIDEADFILIDEARVPLVIACHTQEDTTDPAAVNRAVASLKKEKDFLIEKTHRRIHLTIEGEKKIASLLGCGGMHDVKNANLYASVNVSLYANHLLTSDVDYIIKEGKIKLIDEFTGRIATGRRWPHGIQTALEEKEGLKIQREGRISGSILVQHLINLYKKKAALTATAVPAAEEFVKFYNLTTVIIPSNKPVIREDAPDRVFTNNRTKIKAIVEEIKRVNADGQPVLAGTKSVKESLSLAAKLKQAGLVCEVLNAKNNQREAEIISRAGTWGAITISTNMAGRGTDIKLGGESGNRREELIRLGGLYVIGTNKHESRRVDDQLRGRAGRQGDPGLSRFFISLEDELMTRYGITELLPKEWLESDQEAPIEDNRVLNEITRAQENIEHQNFSIRSTLRNYSAMVEKQRKYVEELRKGALLEQTIPEGLWEKCKIHFQRLARKHPEREVKRILQKLYIFYLDRFWTDQLEEITTLKEGIHLIWLAGEIPLFKFIQFTGDAFEAGLMQVIEDGAKKFKSLALTQEEMEVIKKDLSGPGSTWTYLINDDPLPGFKVALSGSANIGYSVITSIVLSVAAPFIALAGLIKSVAEKIRNRKR